MTMQLITWLKLQEMSVQEFAKKIGKHPSLVHKYIYADVIPKLDTMKKIFLATSGLVSANDFYQLTEEMLKQELVKRKNSHQSLKWILATNSKVVINSIN